MTMARASLHRCTHHHIPSWMSYFQLIMIDAHVLDSQSLFCRRFAGNYPSHIITFDVCARACVRARLASASALTPNEFVMLKCNKMHETRTPSSFGSHLLVNKVCFGGLMRCVLSPKSLPSNLSSFPSLHFANCLDVNTQPRCMDFPQEIFAALLRLDAIAMEWLNCVSVQRISHICTFHWSEINILAAICRPTHNTRQDAVRFGLDWWVHCRKRYSKVLIWFAGVTFDERCHSIYGYAFICFGFAISFRLFVAYVLVLRESSPKNPIDTIEIVPNVANAQSTEIPMNLFSISMRLGFGRQVVIALQMETDKWMNATIRIEIIHGFKGMEFGARRGWKTKRRQRFA